MVNGRKISIKEFQFHENLIKRRYGKHSKEIEVKRSSNGLGEEGNLEGEIVIRSTEGFFYIAQLSLTKSQYKASDIGWVLVGYLVVPSRLLLLQSEWNVR